MAEPISFPQANVPIGLESSKDDLSMSVYMTPLNEDAKSITCWKLTPEEYAEVVKTGRIWVVFHSRKVPPLIVKGISPFS